ncbi:MAG: hypothetical protein IT288_13910 [Bdellovibrionales bacterium]|nr:hypothetical protein [Bdellovibrionales bacterium]
MMQTFVSYRAESNTWQRLPRGAWMPNPDTDYNHGMGHGYEHSFIDPVTRTYFFHQVCNKTVPLQRYNIDTQFWTPVAVPLPTTSYSSGCYTTLVYLPELKAIFYTDLGGAYLLYDNTTKWVTVAAEGSLPMGGYHFTSSYSPVHKVLIFGGGNGGRQMYKLDASAKVTPIKTPPFDIGVNASVLTVDPVSGNFLAFTGNSEFYIYSVTTDTWLLKAAGSSVPIWNSGGYNNPIFGVVATPVSNFGVTMFVTTNGPNAFRVFLYKN